MKDYVIIVSKNCPSCNALKKALDGEKDIEFLDVTEDPRAEEIAEALDIRAVPTIVFINKKKGEICVLDDEFKPEKCIKKRVD